MVKFWYVFGALAFVCTLFGFLTPSFGLMVAGFCACYPTFGKGVQNGGEFLLVLVGGALASGGACVTVWKLYFGSASIIAGAGLDSFTRGWHGLFGG